jgi:hypothetical protein
MPFVALHLACSFRLDLARVLTRCDHPTALQRLLLRQQYRLYERRAQRSGP